MLFFCEFKNIYIIIDAKTDSGNQNCLEVTDEHNNAFVGKHLYLLYVLN